MAAVVAGVENKLPDVFALAPNNDGVDVWPVLPNIAKFTGSQELRSCKLHGMKGNLKYTERQR